MSSLLLLLLPAATSVAMVLIARRAGPGHRGLGDALRLVLELAGISTLFLVANLALGVAIVLAIRTLSAFFVSIYMLNDLSLVALSFLQGAVFFCWRRQPASRHEGGD
jgi:hypothetical protein